jgi:osmotically-inducible protein OsmY
VDNEAGEITKGEVSMSFLSRLFSSKYNDEQLVTQATKAIVADPQTSDPSALLVSSKKGVVTLGGIVPKEQDKGRIEENVRTALANLGLEYEALNNELKTPYR